MILNENNPSSIRLIMLHKAAGLASCIRSEDAYKLTKDFSDNNSTKFLKIVQDILASFLNLPYDIFKDICWPLQSQFDILTTKSNSEAKRRRVLKPGLLFSQLTNHYFSPDDRKHYFILADYLLDYMSQQNSLFKTEGIFRRNGNHKRIKTALSGFLKILNENNDINTVNKTEKNRNNLYNQFAQCSNYDLAGCLMKSLSRSTTHLVDPNLTDIMIKATELQYSLKEDNKNYQDWDHCLCKARQLLTYRICCNFLIPATESKLLFKLLRFLHCVSENEKSSKMDSRALATCLLVLVFGLNSSKYSELEIRLDSSIKSHIDTLANLIRYYPDLEGVPGPLYTEVRCLSQIMINRTSSSSMMSKNDCQMKNFFHNWRRQKSSVQFNVNSCSSDLIVNRSQSSTRLKRKCVFPAIFD